MDLPPELLLKIFEFLTDPLPSNSQQLSTFTRLALVNRLWGSVAAKFLYTSISHQGWKLRRVSACLETLSLEKDTLLLSSARSPGSLPELSLLGNASRRTSGDSDRTSLQATLPSNQQPDNDNHWRHHRDASIPPPILHSPIPSNMLAATVKHLHLRIWSPDSDNTLSDLLLSALTNTSNLATLSLSMSEMFAQHFELLLLRKGIIALESPSEPQPTLLTRSFLPRLNTLDIWPGFRLFQLASGRPVRSISSSTHITGDALKHLVPFFQRSLGPVQKVHFNVTARDTNAVADILRIIAWKLPCLVEVFFNVFVTKRGNSPKFSQDLLELLAPLSSLQTVEILLSRHARSPEPDPYLYQHFAALHSLKATAPNVRHVVLDTIRWLYTPSKPHPPLPSHTTTKPESPSEQRRHQHHPSLSSTPPPISPMSTTSIPHSPPSSNEPSTPPISGINVSSSGLPSAIVTSSRGVEQEEQEFDTVPMISPLPVTFHGNPSSPTSPYISSSLDSDSILEIPTPKSASSVYPPSPFTSTSVSSTFHAVLPPSDPSYTAPLAESSAKTKHQNSPHPPQTPLTPHTHFPQTPLTPGSFGAPDVDSDALPPIYTGWSPQPSDPRTHMWWLSTYGNAVDARLAMCAMWGGILKDTESDMAEVLEESNSDDFTKGAVDVLGVIPQVEEIGYMFGVDLASAGMAATSDIFAVGVHSHDAYPDETGRYEIEELA